MASFLVFRLKSCIIHFSVKMAAASRGENIIFNVTSKDQLACAILASDVAKKQMLLAISKAKNGKSQL